MERTERDFSINVPELPETLSGSVRKECEQLWLSGMPWTKLRPVEGTDNLSGACCEGCVGCFHLPCNNPVVAIQYNVQGLAQFYCEKHGLEQDEWDKRVYRTGPPPIPKLTKEQEDFIAKLLIKKKKMKEKTPEIEETDLMA